LRDRTASRANGDEEISWTTRSTRHPLSGERPQSRRRAFVEKLFEILNVKNVQITHIIGSTGSFTIDDVEGRLSNAPSNTLPQAFFGEKLRKQARPSVSLSLAKADCRRPAPVHNIAAEQLQEGRSDRNHAPKFKILNVSYSQPVLLFGSSKIY